MPHRRVIGSREAFLVFMLLGFSLPAMALPLAVTASAERLTIEGLAPRASVAILGVAHEPAYYMPFIASRRELLTDDDGDGKIVYAPPRGIAFRSIWIVTDLATGETTIATRLGFKALEMVQRGAGRGHAVDVVGDILDVGRDGVDILLVRPNKGAWTIPIRGRGTEETTVSGRLRVHVAKLRPVRPSFGSAPPALLPGDVVVMLDPEQLEYWLRTIPGGGH
jgi:hypothetical protein